MSLLSTPAAGCWTLSASPANRRCYRPTTAGVGAISTAAGTIAGPTIGAASAGLLGRSSLTPYGTAYSASPSPSSTGLCLSSSSEFVSDGRYCRGKPPPRGGSSRATGAAPAGFSSTATSADALTTASGCAAYGRRRSSVSPVSSLGLSSTSSSSSSSSALLAFTRRSVVHAPPSAIASSRSSAAGGGSSTNNCSGNWSSSSTTLTTAAAATTSTATATTTETPTMSTAATLTTMAAATSSAAAACVRRRMALLDRGEDALERTASGPVRLTGYRDLSESRIHRLPPPTPLTATASSSPNAAATAAAASGISVSGRRDRADSLSRGMRRLSVTDVTSSGRSTVSRALFPATGAEESSRASSGASSLAAAAAGGGSSCSESGMGSRSITPSSSYQIRALGSSSSSVDSIDGPTLSTPVAAPTSAAAAATSASACAGVSSERVARPLVRHHRVKRASSISGDSSSGISVGSRGSARSLGSNSSNGSVSEVAVSTSQTTAPAASAVLGLRNLGNSCFMNSILQCLAHIRPLAAYFRPAGDYRADVNFNSAMRGDLAHAFASLLASMWSSSGRASALSPTEFRSQIQKYAPRFMGYAQQDAQEFLRYLLQGLHEDVNRVRVQPRGSCLPEIDSSLSDAAKAAESWRRYVRLDESRMVDLFVGQLKSTLQCSACGHKSVTFDPFWDLSLPLLSATGHGSASLRECLELFTSDELLDGDEKPTCERCKKRQRMTKNLSIWKCPKILVLHLKRFGNSERYRSKLGIDVHFPLKNLDMSAFVSKGGDPHISKYNLIAVSNHSGSTHSGHYTASCFNASSRTWFCCNDARVSEINEAAVVSSEAYVLFYGLDGGTFSRL